MIYPEQKYPGFAVPKIFNSLLFWNKPGPAIEIHFEEASKFLVIRLAARIMSLFVYIFLIGEIMKLQDIQLLQGESQ